MRWSLWPVFFVIGCSAPSASYERSLRRWLRAPEAARESRAADLRAMAAQTHVTAGVRLAAVHQSRRADQSIDADAWLDAEAGAFPGAARFLASYRKLMQLPERPMPEHGRGVVLVVVVDRTRQPDVLGDLLATVERPLRERGYYVVPVEVADDIVPALEGDQAQGQLGRVDPASLRRMAEFGIDTCLMIDILDFWLHEALAVEVVRYEVWYQLVDTATGEIVWRRPATGSYERRETTEAFPREDEPFFYPGSLGPVFADQIDFVRSMTRGLVRTAPRPR